jgi:hypothetical protein
VDKGMQDFFSNTKYFTVPNFGESCFRDIKTINFKKFLVLFKVLHF